MVFGRKRGIAPKAVSPRSIKRFRPAFPIAAAGRSTVQNLNVQVFVRVRPLNSKEKEKSERNVIDVVDATSLVFDPKESDMPGQAFTSKAFTFDRVFDPEATNSEVFEYTTKSIIKTLLDGYNCTVFSYGATGAGKTYTMLGNNEDKGIMYLTMVELYSELNRMKEDHDIQLYVLYVEVYNEAVHDLLEPAKKNLHLLEEHGTIVIKGVTMKEIHSEDELFQLLVEGNRNRTQHPTDANAESSRSHAVFQVFAKMAQKGTDQFKHFKLSMIDLAGSERAAATQNVRARFKERSNINKSLMALGNVIKALADKQRNIPFRSSKLTMLLKDVLGGNCKTIMIANLSPTLSSYEDSYNTLQNADWARKLMNKMEGRNNVLSVAPNLRVYKKMCDDQLREIDALKSEVERLKTELENQGPPNLNCTCQLMSSAEVENLKHKLHQLYKEKSEMIKEVLSLQSQNSIIDFAIKSKQTDLQWFSELDNEMESSKEEEEKLKTTLSQLKEQLSVIMNAKISKFEEKARENNEQIQLMKDEIKNMGLHDSLSAELHNFELMLQNTDITKKYSLCEKMSCLQSDRLDDLASAFAKVGKMTDTMVKGENGVTSDIELEFKTAWKENKALTWKNLANSVERLADCFLPMKLFLSNTAKSIPELPSILISKPATVSSTNPVSTSSNPPRLNHSNNLNGTSVMPSNAMPSNPKRSSPSTSMSVDSPASSAATISAAANNPLSLKALVIATMSEEEQVACAMQISKQAQSAGQAPIAKSSQLNKENGPLPSGPLPDAKMPPPAPTPGKTLPSVDPSTSGESSSKYTCAHCKKIFISKLFLHKHISSRHFAISSTKSVSPLEQRGRLAKKKHFKCAFCAKKFAFPSALKMHERVHTGKKPYKCGYCSTKFSLSGNLKNHERIHTGEKPFKCNVCSAAFRRNSHLKEHQRIHTGEKPFKCKVCAAKFSFCAAFKAHERSHTGVKPYKCSHCLAAFSYLSSLKDHERTHTGDKPYKCVHCSAAFAKSSNLKKHVRRCFQQGKLYECAVCSAGFFSSVKLRQHELSHEDN